jgi:hypothetical protein
MHAIQLTLFVSFQEKTRAFGVGEEFEVCVCWPETTAGIQCKCNATVCCCCCFSFFPGQEKHAFSVVEEFEVCVCWLETLAFLLLVFFF